VLSTCRWVILIPPKAKQLLKRLQASGDSKGICFNPGADPFEGERYDLGLFQTENGELFCLRVFDDDLVHVSARKKWNER